MRALPSSLSPHVDAAHLPPRPQALSRLLQAVGGDAAPVAAIAAIVACDAGLAFRVAAAANAPDRRAAMPRTDLADCVAALGPRLIRTLATSLSVRAMFDRPDARGVLNLDAFTAHAVLVAELAHTLATESGFPRPADARLAGLLHDTGILAGLQALGPRYAAALARCPDETDLAGLEVDRFATDHAEVGAWLADQCDFSGETGDAILFHHARLDDIATASALPQMLWLAHAVASGHLDRQPTQADALYGLWRRLAGPEGEPDLERLLARARRAVAQATAATGVTLAADGLRRNPAEVLPRPAPATPAGATPDVAPDAAAGAVDLAVGEQALAHAMQDELADLADRAALLARLRQSAHILFGLAPVVVVVPTADGVGLEAPADPTLPPAARRARWRCDGDDLVGRALRAGAPEASFDGGTLGGADQVLLHALGAGGLLALPLRTAAGALAGVLLAGLTRARHDALRPRQASLQRFAALAGRSLDAIARTEAQQLAQRQAAAGRHERFARLLGAAAGTPLETARARLQTLSRQLPRDAEADAGAALARLLGEIDRVAGIVDRMAALATTPSESD